MFSRIDSWKWTHFLKIDHTRKVRKVFCKESIIKKKKNTLIINKSNKNQNWEKQSFKRKNIAESMKECASDTNLKITQS